GPVDGALAGEAPANGPAGNGAATNGSNGAVRPGGTPATTPGERSDGGPVDVPAMEVRGLAGRTVAPFDLTVRAGETVGVAGISGSGRDELAPLIWGAVPYDGTVSVLGRTVKAGSPEASRRAGIGFLPANRKANGVVGTLCLRENLNFPDLSSCRRPFGISRRRELAETREWLKMLGVQPADPEADVLTLSGGNQQKLVLGRALRLAPKVLVLDEPTQGVDLGAKEQLYSLIRARAAQGMALVVCSSDSGDLVALCDRVLVFQGGRVTKVLYRPTLSVDAIDRACVESVTAAA
ncbi:MAG TPA: ATP-binding cassette domain-containing protein, partial [Acidimicrobiales bacterium]|nr:ATP-binding cassette domain-containing protein [Acidimicrobiales bacterium]